MLTLAVALAMSCHAKAESGYLLPLRDIVAELSGNMVTGQFNIGKKWSEGMNVTFAAYFENGIEVKISPNGGWSNVSPNAVFTHTVGSDIISFAIVLAHSEAHGKVWIQCSGGPNDSPNGAEVSVAATVCNAHLPVSRPGPGAIVPINLMRRTYVPDFANYFSAAVNTYTYTPNPNIVGFKTWQSNGPSAVAAPGNGWTAMPNSGFTSGQGNQVKTSATSSTNVGFYMVSLQELCDEVYAGSTHKWQEYSAVIRPIP